MADIQYGDLTLTTAQIQERLNQVPENKQAIADLQEAIKAFVNSEQVQQAIATALAPYSTTADTQTAISTAIAQALTDYYTSAAVDALIKAEADRAKGVEATKVDKVSGKQLSTEDFTTALKTKLTGLPDATALSTQISTAITDALKSYSTTTAMNTAISTAVGTEKTRAEGVEATKANKSDVYTKTETDTLLSPKQTAAQVSAAITAALASYYTKTQVDASQQTQDEQIAALKTAVAGLEAMAEGYVRVAGSSSPALSFRSYKFSENGDFSRESAFSMFYPCLIGTKLTGDDEQVGTILHVLQKLGYEDGNGNALDIYGNPRKLDGSEGDVMITNIEPLCLLAGHFTVEGTEYDAFLLSREPFSWHGYEAEELEVFGWSPDYCVSHQDTDGVQRMHSVYNPEWLGSYNAPVGVSGKYIYHQNEETGAITDEFDSEATLLGGAGGLMTTDKSLPTGEQEAMNQNPDTTETVPFFNHTAEGCNRMQALLLAEGGTFDAHNATRFGSGFCANDAANAAEFEAAGSEARNGLRYQNGQGETVYLNLNVNNAFGISNQYTGAMVNSWRNPWHLMEAHRAVSYAVRRGVGELEWFVFEGNKYKYRSVPGFRGPQDGEMTCVVWKVLSAQFTNAAIDPADGTTHLTGRRIDFIFTTGLLHGITTQTSPSWWTSGLIFTEDENRVYQCYLERDQASLLKSPTADIAADEQYPFETAYPLVLADVEASEGYARDYLDHALMLPRTNAMKSGGGLHTYVGKYNWFTGDAAPAGKKSVRGFRRGLLAYYPNLSPFSLYAYNAPSYAASHIGFGTCVRIRRR